MTGNTVVFVDMTQINERKHSLIKKIVDDVAYDSNVLRFCTSCGKKYHDDSNICQNCENEIPKPKENYFGDLSYENFQLLYINQILFHYPHITVQTLEKFYKRPF